MFSSGIVLIHQLLFQGQQLIQVRLTSDETLFGYKMQINMISWRKRIFFSLSYTQIKCQRQRERQQ